MSDDDFHFAEEAWLGLALHLVPAGEAERMRVHLEHGCVQCGKSYEFWRLVSETAAREHVYEPPRDLIQSVKAAFPLTRKLSLLPRLAQSARLMFDSYYQPLPAGVRGGDSEARQLLYDLDVCWIDLRLEPEEDARIAMAGQILAKRAGGLDTKEIAVLVTEPSHRFFRHALVNAHGEFQLELVEPGALDLYLRLPDSTIKHIGIPAAA